MEPYGQFRIFLSCKFPLSKIAKLCQSLADAIDTKLIAANRPEAVGIMEKVKKEMKLSDAALFLIEEYRENDDQNGLSDWIKAEFVIANSMNKPFCIISNTESPLPSFFLKDIEILKLNKLDPNEWPGKISSFLYSLKQQIKASKTSTHDISEPTFIRDFVKHRVKLLKEGNVRYETEVKMTCLKDGLSDVKHSIHMNYSFCWLDDANCERPSIELIKTSPGHDFLLEPYGGDNTKYTWKINIKPPLKKFENVSYGFRSNFIKYFPLQRKEIEHLTSQPDYPFPDGCIEHHFFINNPTDLLILKVQFEDGLLIGNCKPIAFVGRTFSHGTIDRIEVNRIEDCLDVDEFLGRKDVTLTVEKPNLGYNYAVLWSLV